jgi:hypothetical protein
MRPEDPASPEESLCEGSRAKAHLGGGQVSRRSPARLIWLTRRSPKWLRLLLTIFKKIRRHSVPGRDEGVRVMGRLAVIACTFVLSLSAAAALAREPDSRQAQQRAEAAAPKSDAGTTMYSCRLNPKQPRQERRKKVSLICEPPVRQ